MPTQTSQAELLGILGDLTEAGCRFWVAGGWAVDLTVGRQTRPHRDLDLAVDASDLTTALTTLARRGYRVETDWLPVRVEVAADERGRVDLHPSSSTSPDAVGRPAWTAPTSITHQEPSPSHYWARPRSRVRPSSSS